jgi:succinoglycan biosynthesis transport protein ExoP
MLQFDKRVIDRAASAEYPDALPAGVAAPRELLTALVAFTKRQYPVIIFVAAIIVAMGLAYLYYTPPSYTAQATMIIDTRKVQIFPQAMLGELGIDASTVESQLEVLKSENIALAIIKKLRLAEDPEFVRLGGGPVSSILRFVSGLSESDGPTSEFNLMRSAVRAFQNRLSVKRVALTYVIEISFTSQNAERAAQVANAVIDAYFADQLDAKYQATRRASLWLQERLRELRDQASAAERAVVEFKTRNNIVDTGGRLMNEQQLAEVSSQRVLAHAQTAEAQARLERIQAIIRAGNVEATVTDALANPVIVRLRQQLLDVNKREAEWSSRYGAEHLAVVNLRGEVREIRKSILDELTRIAQTYQSDYEIATAREVAIQQSLAEVVSTSQTTSQAQVALRELESSAQAYRALYDNLLQRYMESVQQQSYPVTEARFITQATRPTNSSHPKTFLALVISLAAGMACGMGVALVRELADRTIRTTDRVEDELGLECIALLPAATQATEQRNNNEKRAPDKKRNESALGPRAIVRGPPLFWRVIDEPFSRFTEGIRSIKVAVDLSGLTGNNRVIGVTSALPNEGKSTVAMNLAQLIAHAGQRVVLVDGDLRNPSLTRSLAPSASSGLIEAISGKLNISEAVWTDPSTALEFLPVAMANRLPHTNEIMASDATRDIFTRLRQAYDYVIVDLPPLAPVVDVRSTAHLIDSVVFVIEWGVTKIDVITHSLRRSQVVRNRVLGAVLNKVNMTALSRLESHRGNYYDNKYYSRYGYVE